jgi:hypothetical protein
MSERQNKICHNLNVPQGRVSENVKELNNNRLERQKNTNPTCNKAENVC